MDAIKAFNEYCDAFAIGDAARVAELFTEDARFCVPMAKEPTIGRSNIARDMRQTSGGQKDISVKVLNAIEEDGVAYIEATYEAEIVGTGGRVDGSPHRADFRFLARIEMDGEQIKELAEFLNTRPLFPDERQKMFVTNRRTPYFDKTVEHGCMEWMVYNTMHFPLVYDHMPFQAYDTLLNDVTLWDVGLERQTQLKGPDALRFMDYLSCRDMSTMKVGDCRYTLLTDDKGLIMSDPVVLFPDAGTIWISHGNTDITLWARGIVMGSDWDVEICEPDVAPMQIQGPLSVPLMDEVCDENVSVLKNYKCMQTTVDGMDVVVSRTGWSSGEGFEIYPLSSDYCVPIWEKLERLGEKYNLRVVGAVMHRAIERGVTDIGYYMNSEMNALEDLSNKFVHLDSDNDFIGKEALLKIRDNGVQRKGVGLLFESDVPRMEWFWDLVDANGHPGVVRWAIHSFALDQSIGIALVDASVELGDTVTVSHPQGVTTATVTEIPFVDRK